MNKLFTRKRVLKTNHKDALIAEGQENSRETTAATEAEASATGGKKNQGERRSPF
jgi:hypothetical protein